METPAIQSPCILVCAIEPVSGQCYGCGRTRDEITQWVQYSHNKREQIMQILPERVEKLERRPRRITRRSRLSGSTSRKTTMADLNDTPHEEGS